MVDDQTEQTNAYHEYFEAIKNFNIANIEYIQSAGEIASMRKIAIQKAIGIHINPVISRLRAFQAGSVIAGILSVIFFFIGLGMFNNSSNSNTETFVLVNDPITIQVNQRSEFSSTYYAIIPSVEVGSNYVNIDFESHGNSDLKPPEQSCILIKPSNQTIRTSSYDLPVNQPGNYQGTLTYNINVDRESTYYFRYSCYGNYTDALLFSGSTIIQLAPQSFSQTVNQFIQAGFSALMILISLSTGILSLIVFAWTLSKINSLYSSIREAQEKTINPFSE